MASVLKLTKTSITGVETAEVDFVADAAYRVVSWSPAVAQRRVGDLGGRGPYEDVEEEMTIVITGASALSKLQTLMGTLDQAARWARGEPVGKVLFRYQPTAGSPELRAVVLGGGEVELPDKYALAPTLTVIDPVVVRFRRSALWLGDDEVKTDTTTGNPEVGVTSVFTPLQVAAPIKVEIEGLLGKETIVGDTFVLVTSGENAATAGKRIVVVAAEGLATSGYYTSVGDSANKARGTVLRLTPGDAGAYYDTIALSVGSTTDQYARRWGVFLNYRNNSATTSWRIGARLWNNYNANGVADTHMVVVPAGVSEPKWVFVGAASLPDSLERITLSIWASAASGTLDIDDVVLLAMDYPDCDRAIAVMNRAGNNTISTTADLVIDHRLLERLSPAVYVQTGSAGGSWWPYQGDATLYMREGCLAVAVAWLATDAVVGSYWRATSGGAAQSPSVRVTRTEAFLTPE